MDKLSSWLVSIGLVLLNFQFSVLCQPLFVFLSFFVRCTVGRSSIHGFWLFWIYFQIWLEMWWQLQRKVNLFLTKEKYYYIWTLWVLCRLSHISGSTYRIKTKDLMLIPNFRYSLIMPLSCRTHCHKLSPSRL